MATDYITGISLVDFNEVKIHKLDLTPTHLATFDLTSEELEELEWLKINQPALYASELTIREINKILLELH